MSELDHADAEIRPFRIEIPQADLDDLRYRLTRTRWANELPPEERGSGSQAGPVPPGWEYGVPVSYVQELVEYWRDGYDWREWEAKLNEYPQFTTEIDGQDIHFLHVRSPEPDATPLILTHGWPNTLVEYLGLIGPLTDPHAHGGDPADAFDVVIPSLPGFAFSGPTTEAGWDAQRTARAWAELMRRLGYDRYGAHGNDAGAIVAPDPGTPRPRSRDRRARQPDLLLPLRRPGRVRGADPGGHGVPAVPAGLRRRDVVHDQAAGAQPQTLAHALADSPAGQLAWSGQLFGDALSPDDILTNASIYWLHQHRGIGGPLLLREQARRTAERADHGAYRPGQLRLRLPADPQVRRTRPRQHRALDGVRPREPLGCPRRTRSPRSTTSASSSAGSARYQNPPRRPWGVRRGGDLQTGHRRGPHTSF